MDKSKVNERCDQLFALDMMFNGDSYVGTKEWNKDFNIHHTEISFDTDSEWDRKIERLKNEHQRRKEINETA